MISKAWEIAENVSFIFHHRSNSAVAEAKIAEESKEKKRLLDEEAKQVDKENQTKRKKREYDDDIDFENDLNSDAECSDDEWIM